MNAIAILKMIDREAAAEMLLNDTHNAHVGQVRVLVCDPKSGECRTRAGNEWSEEEYYQTCGAKSIFPLTRTFGYCCDSCHGEYCDNLIPAEELVAVIEQAIYSRIEALESERLQAS